MRLIATIEGEPIIEMDDLSLLFRAKAAIDGDGSGEERKGDTFEPDTSLHFDGKALNSDVDKYVVVPPAIIEGVAGVVLGCQARLANTLKDGWANPVSAVVGDIGPHHKLGEVSIACAEALGIPSSPTTGGEERHVIEYRIYPGVAAEVDGKLYTLQPA